LLKTIKPHQHFKPLICFKCIVLLIHKHVSCCTNNSAGDLRSRWYFISLSYDYRHDNNILPSFVVCPSFGFFSYNISRYMLQIQIELHCKDKDQWVRVVEIYHQGKLSPSKSCLRNLIRRWTQGGFNKRLCDIPFPGSRCLLQVFVPVTYFKCLYPLPTSSVCTRYLLQVFVHVTYFKCLYTLPTSNVCTRYLLQVLVHVTYFKCLYPLQ
jgi:hypothetical protein